MPHSYSERSTRIGKSGGTRSLRPLAATGADARGCGVQHTMVGYIDSLYSDMYHEFALRCCSWDPDVDPIAL
jgi:hypothetical protein